MQCELLGERPAVCVCVFLSLCLSPEATFCPFKAVTDWPPSPVSRSLSCFLSIIPPLSLPLFSFCLSTPIHRSLFLQLYLPPPFLSYLLLSTVARIHPYKSFNPVAGPENLIFFLPLSHQAKKSVNRYDNPACFQCNSFCVKNLTARESHTQIRDDVTRSAFLLCFMMRFLR